MPIYPQTFLHSSDKQRQDSGFFTPAQINQRISSLQPALKHYPPNNSYKLKTSLGQGWRLNYDLLLTENGHTRTLFDEHGRAHVFHEVITNIEKQEQLSGEFIPESSNSGSLYFDSNQYKWLRPDGTIIEFHGSLPVKWIMKDGKIINLNYAAGHLLSVKDNSGGMLTFSYNNNKLTGITLPNSTQLHYRFNGNDALILSVISDQGETLAALSSDNYSSHQQQSAGCREPEEHTYCDAEIRPPPDGFTTAETVPGTIRIDARPQSCRSYFTDYSSIERGVLIETHFSFRSIFAPMEATVRSFPIVDFIGENQLHVAHSRDLTSDTYSLRNENPLYDSLMQDGAEIMSVFLNPLQDAGFLSVNELGENTTIRSDQFDSVVLNLVIRFDIASSHQIAQIQRARRDLFELYGIYLRVIEIP